MCWRVATALHDRFLCRPVRSGVYADPTTMVSPGTEAGRSAAATDRTGWTARPLPSSLEERTVDDASAGGASQRPERGGERRAEPVAQHRLARPTAGTPDGRRRNPRQAREWSVPSARARTRPDRVRRRPRYTGSTWCPLLPSPASTTTPSSSTRRPPTMTVSGCSSNHLIASQSQSSPSGRHCSPRTTAYSTSPGSASPSLRQSSRVSIRPGIATTVRARARLSHAAAAAHDRSSAPSTTTPNDGSPIGRRRIHHSTAPRSIGYSAIS